MTDVGKSLRLAKIFRSDGNALIVAMDHALSDGPIKGLENPSLTIENVVQGGADAVMTTFGIISHYYELLRGKVAIIVRLDGGESAYGEDQTKPTKWNKFYSVEDAVKIGADAVVVMGFIGAPAENDTLKNLADVSRECVDWGMPLLAEMLPFKCGRIKNPYDTNAIAVASRVGFEYGADFIKTYYSGTAESFRTVTDVCPVPILVAGGERMRTGRDVLKITKGIMDGGGRGVVFGRNIWQYRDPKAMVHALRKLIHENASVEDAAKIISEQMPLQV
jgi:DhnA family fructose-bisphosphate aldolase class Ia